MLTLKKFPLIRSLLPSFCRTASHGFIYKFYLAYDYNDEFFIDISYASLFKDVFMGLVDKLCINLRVDLVYVEVPHSGSCYLYVQLSYLVSPYTACAEDTHLTRCMNNLHVCC